ncbi:MAG: DNA alkylation repair protein [Prolixibacteraceae bacterium]
MNEIVSAVRLQLRQNMDEKTRQSGLRFFKEDVKLYGVKSAVVGKISKEHFKAIQGDPKAEIFALCNQLWRSGYMEESFVACNWAYAVRKSYEPADFEVFETWVATCVSNWASCDTLCNHTIGTFIEMYPHYLSRLKTWANDTNRWMKRAAAVSLIIPARNGKFLPEVFELADILLTDQDDLVQKGYGWMLKAASQAHQSEVFEYILENKAVMPRTALRYAIEKMDPARKAAAMAR